MYSLLSLAVRDFYVVLYTIRLNDAGLIFDRLVAYTKSVCYPCLYDLWAAWINGSRRTKSVQPRSDES